MPVLERRAPRHKVLFGAQISEAADSPPTKHRIRDLSAIGARVDAATPLVQGLKVVVALGNLSDVLATVAWVKDGDAGLSFETRIDPEAARSRPTAATSPAAATPARAANCGSHPRVTAGWAAQLHDPYRAKGS